MVDPKIVDRKALQMFRHNPIYTSLSRLGTILIGVGLNLDY
jgi:hypothetical protein